MRCNLILSVVFVMSIFCSLAQNPHPVKKRIELKQVEQKAEVDKADALKFSIRQIEEKIQHIKNNPTLLKEAKASGHLMELNKSRQAYIDELRELKKSK